MTYMRSRGVTVAAVAVFLSVCASLASAAVSQRQAVDFSSPEARALMPRFNAVSSRGEVVDELSSHGRWGYRFTITKGWGGGVPQWPSVNLPPAVKDWTPYDRIVIDAFNAAPGGDCFGAYFAGPDGHVAKGAGTHGLKFLPTHGFVRWEIPLRWPKKMDPANVARVHLFYESPICADVTFSGFWLLKPGETAPEPDAAFIARKVRPAERKLAAERECEVLAARTAFVSRCRAAGQSAPPWIGKATSMAHVMPRDVFSAAAADSFELRLARGETEALQVLAFPETFALTQACVRVSDLASGTNRLSSGCFRLSPVGYVLTKDPAPYPVGVNVSTNLPGGYCRTRRSVVQGWFPDPILDYLTAVDVAKDDVQAFWVSLTCPRSQPAGLYRGELSICGKTFPLTVRVYGFEVPRTSPLPITASFRPEANPRHFTQEDRDLAAAIWADPLSPVNAWRQQDDAWTDFLADHYVSRDWLYHGSRVPWEQLERLKTQGRLGLFNLGCWAPPSDTTDAGRAAFVEKIRRDISPAYEEAKRRNLLSHAYIYGCDECPESGFDRVRLGLQELKRAFPGVPLHTTAYDSRFGIDSKVSDFDVFTPTTDTFAAADPKAIAASRAAGHQVWWYIACNQRAPLANLFVECSPIDGRQLMGAQAVKFRPDGFLYYQLSIWTARRPLSGVSAFTDWDPHAWGRFHGDGGWLCCGPGGKPVSTLRFENFRDGIEDFAYAKEYERVTGRRCDVPPEVCRGIDQFTDDPAAYYAWRDSLAEAIEQAGAVRDGDHIVFCGDSITCHSWTRPNGCNHLVTNALASAGLKGIKVTGLGFCGNTVVSWIGREGRTRGPNAATEFSNNHGGRFVPQDVKKTLDGKVDVVAILLGMNDILMPSVGPTPEARRAWADEFRKLATNLRERTKARELVLGTFTPLTADPEGPKNLVRREMNDHIRRIARELGARVWEAGPAAEQAIAETRRCDPEVREAPDFVHPGDVGHLAMAAAFCSALGETAAADILKARQAKELEKMFPTKPVVSYRLYAKSLAMPDADEMAYDLDWNVRGMSAADVSFELPEGWRCTPAAARGVSGRVRLTGRPERWSNEIGIVAKAGAVESRAVVKVASPWRVSEGFEFPAAWQGWNWQSNAVPPVSPAAAKWTRLAAGTWDYLGRCGSGSVDFYQVAFGTLRDSSYVARRILSDRPRQVGFTVGTEAFSATLGIVVTLNGREVWRGVLPRGARVLKPTEKLQLKKGANELAIRVDHNQWQRQFDFDLIPAPGETLDDLRFDWRP